jgi:hypothetical protein
LLHVTEADRVVGDGVHAPVADIGEDAGGDGERVGIDRVLA